MRDLPHMLQCSCSADRGPALRQLRRLARTHASLKLTSAVTLPELLLLYFLVTLPPKQDLSSSFTSKPALADANTRCASTCTAASDFLPKYSSFWLHLCKNWFAVPLQRSCWLHTETHMRRPCSARVTATAAATTSLQPTVRINRSKLITLAEPHLGRSVRNCTSVSVVSTKYCAIRLSVSSKLPIWPLVSHAHFSSASSVTPWRSEP